MSSEVETCSICGSKVKKSYLRRHQRRNHSESCSKKINQNIKCCVCTIYFSSRQQFRDHVNENHGKIESKQLKFDSIEEFYTWLRSEENKMKIHFIRTRPPRKLSYGNTRVSYYCQYDNGKNEHIIPHDERKRALKYQGSYKLSGCCPAEMIVEENKRTGGVSVLYYSSHLGHNSSMAHFYLQSEQRKHLADKLREGVSFNKILDQIRDNLQPNNLKREDFISRKTLRNISVEFGIETWKKDADDATSVSLWIEEMKKSKHDAICFSKMQGDEDERLDVNDFCLVIMTKIQAQMLREFGDRIVCVDGTHGTNHYNFELTTILVVDDHEEGFPAAHLISNRNDTVAMEVFFRSVRTKIDATLTPSIFMSDDYPAYFNAWINVMNSEIRPKKLLCAWHVDKNWREALSKIECKKGEVKMKQVEVYQMLRFLLEEMDETVFKKSLQIVVNDLLADDSTQKFGKYFQSYYANRPETWAYCYRIGAGVNTNMRIENYHRLIKTVYHNGTKMKRLDACIDTLLKIVRDKAHERIMKLIHVKAPYIVRKINAAHRRSCEINDEDVTEKDSHYLVKAQSNPNSSYTVKKDHESCPYNCDVICNACNVCQHIYSCTCVDFLVKTHMCKHVHKVCTLLRSKNNVSITLSDPICENTSAVEVDRKLEIIELMKSTPKNDDSNNVKNESIIKELNNYIEKVTTLLAKSQTPVFGVKKIIIEAKKVLFKYNKKNRIPVKSSSPINKKIKQQRRLYGRGNSDIRTVSKKLFSTCQKKLDVREIALKKPTKNQKDVYRRQFNISAEDRQPFVDISNTFDHIFA